MWTRFLITLGIFAPVYVYLAYYWTTCLSTQCQISGDMIMFTLVAMIAAPVILLLAGVGLALGGVGKLREGVKAKSAGQTANASVGLALGFKLMVVAVPAVAALAYLALDIPEEGRDRLGRICEKTRSGEVCRPDPDADRPSELDRINALRKRGS